MSRQDEIITGLIEARRNIREAASGLPPEKCDEGVGEISVQRDEKVLRIADGTHNAPDGHGETQGEQEGLGRHLVFLRQ